MTDREKKRGRWKYKNLNLKNEKNFLDEIKSIFYNYLRAIFNFRFYSRKSKSQQKLVKEITYLTIQFCSNNFTHFKNLN